MTVRRETKVNRYIGVSGDRKPEPGHTVDGEVLTVDDVPTGSTFLAVDTNELWHWNGWEWIFTTSPEVRELQEIKSLLAAILEQGVPEF